MDLSPYHYEEYREFIAAWIVSRPSNGHGERAKIAAAISVHPAYVSQVLKGEAHLSQEQIFSFGQHIALGDDEIEFLLLLMQRDRAGKAELRNLLTKKISKIRDGRKNLKNRIKVDDTLKPEDQATYFSEWYYSIIHLVASTLPESATMEKLQKRLRLSRGQITKAIQFLEEKNLIQREKERYIAGSVNLHLGTDSPFLNQMNTNWRLQAIRSIEDPKKMNLHYSSAVTVNASDAEKIHELLLRTIDSIRKVVADSKKETEVQVLCLDFFRLGE